MKRSLPPAVFVLGFVSFLTDVSSEMIFPLLPAFLASEFGATALAIGLIEGVAEATSSVVKLASGIGSDRGRKKPFVVFGYGLSGLARPLVGLAGSWPAVLAIRFFDRVGKGIRTSPRDALIADLVDDSMRGRAYGVQRAMDHAGSVVGPLVASALLLLPFMTTRHVFLWAAVPAAMAMIALIFFVDERETDGHVVKQKLDLRWSILSPDFKRLSIALFVFTLGLSTDAFLLLRLNDVGVPAGGIALLWAIHSLVKSISTKYGGTLSDRFGDRRLMILSWVFYAALYFAFSLDLSREAFVALFLAYGVYYGLSEPSERSVVSKLASATHRGTAFGVFHLVTGVAALPASLLFGFVWQTWGVSRAFQMGGLLALVACGIMAFGRNGRIRNLGVSDLSTEISRTRE
jgi:sugar phosphate permease